MAHLSALGTGCVLGGVKRAEPLVFVGSMRIDAFVWGAGLLADTIHEPFPVVPYSTSVYSFVYNLPESSYRTTIADLVQPADIPSLNASTRHLFEQFGTRLDLWEDTLCYEIMPEPPAGETMHNIVPSEYGCIWSDLHGEQLHAFHAGPESTKYFRTLSKWVGWNWHTVDYLHVSTIYMRATLRMVSTYTIDNDGHKMVHHWIATDLGIDGILYFAMLAIEIIMIVINSANSFVVALLVVRPLILATQREHSYTITSEHSTVNTSSIDEKKGSDKSKRDETLLRMLLYTDLCSVSFRKQLLAMLMVVDTFFSWFYIIPNSTVYAWSTNAFQLMSAYMTNFRIWSVVIVFIDYLWRFTFVLASEKLAALITDLTYISSFEIMIATLLSVLHSYNDLLNLCLIKWGTTDRQREMFPTVPGLYSFYNSYSKYSYGDRSNDQAGSQVVYNPLLGILGWAIFYSIVIIVLRLGFNVAMKAVRGTLRKDVVSYWRTYQRNSVEVFMNDPLRAKALVRSQSIMCYRFGRSVFIRPFVYLEQNYYIYHSRFRRRPLFPLVDLSDSINGAEVNAKSYQLEGVYHDQDTNKIKKKRHYQDAQIPLC